MQSKVFAIIVTYNGSQWIRQCLNSLKDDIPPEQIIVVDNNSTDPTVAIIRENYPSVQLWLQKHNLGFGKANNLGIKHALEEAADYVLLLNQDAWLASGTLQKMQETLQANPEIAILSPSQFDGSQKELDHLFSTYLEKKVQQYNNLTFVPFVNAAIWLMPRTTLVKVGGFDPLFPHYGEDVDFVNRCHYLGLKIAIQTNLSGYHDRDSSKILPLTKRKYFEFINALVELKNINKSFIRSLMIFVLRTLRYFFGAIFKGWLTSAKDDLITLAKITVQIPQILLSRKKCASKKGNRLFLK
ncbi:MAG: glycosyltransferase family 2 protein [Reichenbachiella sp.]|uniref:glycosyltransferase family 2 protein n=1 Tax=Reichenbachiella sp. TaxID=2184521 RepID=UPI003263E52A